MPTILTDAHGRTVTVTYDEFTRVTKRQHPDGTTELFAYNAFGEPTLQVDRLNRATRKTYDSLGNMLTRTVGQVWNVGTNTADDTTDTATTTWIYAQIGSPGLSRCIAEIDARGNRTDYGYQGNGQVVTITTPADVLGDPRPVTTLTYTTAGLVSSIAEPALSGTRLVQFAYDLRNRLVTTTYADTSTERVTYGTGLDANLVIGQTDRNGNQTVRGFDLAGRKISEEIRGAANLGLALHRAEWTYLDGTEQVLTARNDGDSSRPRSTRPLASLRPSAAYTTSTTASRSRSTVTADARFSASTEITASTGWFRNPCSTASPELPPIQKPSPALLRG
jgi:YD repeat-containing protein